MLKPGDFVLVDNLRSHKVAGVGGVHRSLRSQTNLPAAYSSNISPIEKFRPDQSPASLGDATPPRRPLRQYLSIAKTVSAQEISNYFKAAGYSNI